MRLWLRHFSSHPFHPRCRSRSAWAEGGQNTWLCLCEGQAGSGLSRLSSPAAVHAPLAEGPVGIRPLGIDYMLHRHGDSFLGAHGRLQRAAQAETQVRSQIQWGPSSLSSSRAFFQPLMNVPQWSRSGTCTPFIDRLTEVLWCLMNWPSLWSMSAGKALIVVGKPLDGI